MGDLIKGLYPKPKHENAPSWKIGKASINIAQFREWMGAYIKENPDQEWVNMELLVAKSGKGYAAIDDWKPEPKVMTPPQPPADEDAPF